MQWHNLPFVQLVALNQQEQNQTAVFLTVYSLHSFISNRFTIRVKSMSRNTTFSFISFLWLCQLKIDPRSLKCAQKCHTMQVVILKS